VVNLLDIELKDILMKLLDGQNKLDTKVSGLDTRLSGLEMEVRKNSVQLEAMQKNIAIIAEVQTSPKEQNERSYEKMLQEQENKITLITSSLKSVSDDVIEVKKDIKDLKEKFDKVEKVTMQNTYDLAYLKSVK
jgi:septal ring factor EnvC (AmiA/AmiB activator)